MPNPQRVTIGVGPATHGQATGLAVAGMDLHHKLNGHDGTHTSCCACQAVRMHGPERALRHYPRAFSAGLAA